MFLVYINALGADYKGDAVYEFIFNGFTENVSGEDWDISPALDRPKPPELEYIQKVVKINDKSIKLDLIQSSEYFSVFDAVDGVIALGWECMENDFEHEKKRLVFQFGEKEETVLSKLKERQLKIEEINIQ